MTVQAKAKGGGDAALAFVFCGAISALILLPVTQLLDLKRAAGFLAAGLLCLGLAWRIWGKQPLQKPAGSLSVALLLVVAAWMLAGSGGGLRSGMASRGQMLSAGVLLAWGLASLPQSWGDRLVFHWRRAALLVAVWALLQRAGLEWMPAYAAAGSKLRAMGSYGNAGYLAAFLCLSWPLALEWHGRSRHGALALLFAGLLATQSRAGLLAAGVQAAWLGWKAYNDGLRPGRVLLLTLAAALVLIAVYFPAQAWLRPTLRPQLWQAAIELWSQHPLLGWGPGSFALAVQSQLGASVQATLAATGQFVEDPHQVFLAVGAESGLLGLAAFVFALSSAWRLSREQATPRSRWLLLGGLGLLVESCADRFFFQPGVFLPACAALGLLAWRAPLAAVRPRWQALLLLAGAVTVIHAAGGPLLAYSQAVGQGSSAPQISAGLDESGLRARLAADPRDATVHEQLGALLASRGDFANAADAYAKALTLAPRAALAQNLGNCRFMLKDFVQAEAAFRQAAGLDPTSADAQFSLGYALFQQRRLREAAAALDAALKIDHGHAGALKLKEQLLN